MKQLFYFALPAIACNAQTKFDSFGPTWQKETFDHVSRVQADGGYIHDIAALDQAITQAKADGSWDKTAIWTSPIFGVKKDVSGYVSKMYNVKYALGSNLVNNGVNWTDSNSDGLADGMLIFGDSGNTLTSTIVTGNGFAGNAQRVVKSGSSWVGLHYPVNLANGKRYKYSVKYRTNSSAVLFREQKSGVASTTITTLASNTGNAVAISGEFVSAQSNSDRIFFDLTACVNGQYLEIDEYSVCEIISSDLEQTTAASQPLYVENGQNGKPVIRFDAINDWLKSSAMTLNRPEIIYLGLKMLEWKNDGYIFDGQPTYNTMALYQAASSPGIRQNAGASGSLFNELSINVFGLLKTVYNGASSSIQLNNNTAISASSGTNNASGFTLGAAGNNTSPANIEVSEIRILKELPTSQQDASIKAAINSIWRIY